MFSGIYHSLDANTRATKRIGDKTMEKKVEHKVGEVFEYEGNKLITTEIENNFCNKCFFLYVGHECDKHICLSSERVDKKNVVFKFVE